MTYVEVAEMVEEIGLSFNYYQFPPNEAPEPPFLLFYYPGSADFIADNKNYTGITALRLELYTNEKDFTSEAAVETVLQAAEIPYQKTEMYIDSEQLFEVVYESEVLING